MSRRPRSLSKAIARTTKNHSGGLAGSGRLPQSHGPTSENLDDLARSNQIRHDLIESDPPEPASPPATQPPLRAPQADQPAWHERCHDTSASWFCGSTAPPRGGRRGAESRRGDSRLRSPTGRGSCLRSSVLQVSTPAGVIFRIRPRRRVDAVDQSVDRRIVDPEARVRVPSASFESDLGAVDQSARSPDSRSGGCGFESRRHHVHPGPVAQSAEAAVLRTAQCRFESCRGHPYSLATRWPGPRRGMCRTFGPLAPGNRVPAAALPSPDDATAA